MTKTIAIASNKHAQLMKCVIEHRSDMDGIPRPTVTELEPLTGFGLIAYKVRRWFTMRKHKVDPQYTWDDIDSLDYALDVDPVVLRRFIDPALHGQEKLRMVITPTEHVIHAATNKRLADKDPEV